MSNNDEPMSVDEDENTSSNSDEEDEHEKVSNFDNLPI